MKNSSSANIYSGLSSPPQKKIIYPRYSGILKRDWGYARAYLCLIPFNGYISVLANVNICIIRLLACH